jgi:aminomuconate-semialdehyde/2-hydroxymuconate-6-semialdehyde dehydrogenase
LVYGYGRECGSALVEHEDVRLVSFTGGTATGRVVGRVASEMFKKVSLELGGKNAMLVFDDCDLTSAVATAKRASFSNQGEICLCASRILVQESIYEEFLNKFVE